MKERKTHQPKITDSETQKFITKYRDGLERRYQRLQAEKPIHPETGEVAEFVGFLRNYPIYRTSSGKELITKKGKSIPLVRNQNQK